MSEKRKLISGSSALRTNDIWSKTIGLDAHAGADDGGVSAAQDSEQTANLLLLAKMQSSSGEARGGCKRCGGVGHLTFQCRNPIASAVSVTNDSGGFSSDSSDDSTSDSDSDSDNDSGSDSSGSDTPAPKQKSKDSSREEKKLKEEKKKEKKEKKKQKKREKKEKKKRSRETDDVDKQTSKKSK